MPFTHRATNYFLLKIPDMASVDHSRALLLITLSRNSLEQDLVDKLVVRTHFLFATVDHNSTHNFCKVESSRQNCHAFGRFGCT